MEPPARDAWEAFSTLPFVISERMVNFADVIGDNF